MSTLEPAAGNVNTYTITVSMTVSAGNVSFHFSKDRLKADAGTDVITFRRKSGQSWTFLGIAIYDAAGTKPTCAEAASSASIAAPFTLLNTAADYIVVEDANSGASRADFHYMIAVDDGGTQRCSDPEIINKAND
jgi:hypothetical protein